jgi:hypothetical protein
VRSDEHDCRAKLFNQTSFADVRVDAETVRALASSHSKSSDSAFSGKVTSKSSSQVLAGSRHTGKQMRAPGEMPSFGQDLVEALKSVLAHQRGEIKLEQVLPKPRAAQVFPQLDRELRKPRLK